MKYTMKRYNISPTCHHIWHSEDEIRAAAEHGMRLYLDVGPRYPRIPCRVAAIVHGWVTAVGEGGAIYQDWAGAFHHTCDGRGWWEK